MIDSADLRKLSKKRRNRNVLEDIKESVLGELEELKEKASAYSESLSSLGDTLDELEESLGGLLEHEVISDDEHSKRIDAIAAFREAFKVGEEDETPDLDSAVGTLSEKVDEYEGIMDDRDYTADDRESCWGELQGALEDVADALDAMQGKAEE